MFGPILREQRAEPAFLAKLRPFDPGVLDEDPCVVYGATPDFRIAYVNRAFTSFWGQNGGAAGGRSWGGIGTSLLGAIRGRLRGFYQRKFQEALARQEPWVHTYQCSSPREFRLYQMRVLPVPEAGWLVLNSLVEELPFASGRRRAAPAVPDIYKNEQGMLLQCSSCRRVRLARSSPPRWDWVPAFVEHVPAGTSHGICRACVGYYYPEYARPRDRS